MVGCVKNLRDTFLVVPGIFGDITTVARQTFLTLCIVSALPHDDLKLCRIGDIKFAPLLDASFFPSADVQQILILRDVYDSKLLFATFLGKPLVAEIAAKPAAQKRDGPKGPSRVRMTPPLRLKPSCIAGQ